MIRFYLYQVAEYWNLKAFKSCFFLCVDVEVSIINVCLNFLPITREVVSTVIICQSYKMPQIRSVLISCNQATP